MATGITKTLGYGGSAEIDGVQMLLSSGGFENAVAPSYINAYDIDPSEVPRSRMLHADGVNSYTGSIGFEVTQAALGVISTAKLLKRYYKFNIGINDGDAAYVMEDCYVTSLSLTGAPGGLITAQLGVAARAKQSAGLVADNYILRDAAHQPYGYWYSGNTDVRDWSLSMTQDVQPVYSNENTMDPRYMKVGLVVYSLQVTTYDAVQAHDTIGVATSSFTLQGETNAEGYTFNGITDLGMYSHTFESSSDATVGSQDPVIT